MPTAELTLKRRHFSFHDLDLESLVKTPFNDASSTAVGRGENCIENEGGALPIWGANDMVEGRRWEGPTAAVGQRKPVEKPLIRVRPLSEQIGANRCKAPSGCNQDMIILLLATNK